MTEGSPSYCFECKRPLVEIYNRGQRLHGCMTCNIWSSLRGGGAVKLFSGGFGGSTEVEGAD